MGVDKAFSELDTKGDNKISPEELAAFFKVSKQAITYYSIIESDPEENSPPFSRYVLLHILVYISVYTLTMFSVKLSLY